MKTIEEERRDRIRVALWAYAYELQADPLVSDDVFDKVCLEVDLNIKTGHDMDEWYEENFEPHTGQWIHKYPNLDRLKEIYTNIKIKQAIQKILENIK